LSNGKILAVTLYPAVILDLLNYKFEDPPSIGPVTTTNAGFALSFIVLVDVIVIVPFKLHYKVTKTAELDPSKIIFGFDPSSGVKSKLSSPDLNTLTKLSYLS